MNFQQLRAAVQIGRTGLSLSELAEVLHTTQPALSRQVRDLEEELGLQLFKRAGKRFDGLTDEGARLLPLLEGVLTARDNLSRASADLRDSGTGTLRIGATHTQARYALPEAVVRFREEFPEVTLHMHQGSPAQVAGMLLSGEVDVGVATETLGQVAQIVTLPGYSWSHSVIVPKEHPLIGAKQPLTLANLARFPLITYEEGFTGRAHIDAAFARGGLIPNITMAAMDADVIKTYVHLKLGVGIIASMAYSEERDSELTALDASHLIEQNTTRVGLKRGLRPRTYHYRFIELFAPHLTRAVVDTALEEVD